MAQRGLPKRVDLPGVNTIEFRKVTAPITFRISRPKGPLLSGSSYFQTVKVCEQSIPRNSLNEVNIGL